MSPADQEILWKIVDIVDGACWEARRVYGHEDVGLEDEGVHPVTGVRIDDDSDECDDAVHPSAWSAGQEIVALLRSLS